MFCVKVKIRKINSKPLVDWMKPDVTYPVLDVYKYLRTDKDTGIQTFVTWFLIGDKDTGILSWVSSSAVDYAEERQL